MNIRRQRGLSIIELMIAMTLGLLILAGLTTVFVTASESQRELQRSAQQIENGRYAMDTLSLDLHHAGFYGRYSGYADPVVSPDPCIIGNEAALATSLRMPVQVYLAADQSSRPSLTGTGCATYLPTANLLPGSDILVVRRAETTSVRYIADGFKPVVTSNSATLAGEVYMQTDPSTVIVQFGDGTAITPTSDARGGTSTINKKDTKAEAWRKLHVHIYFVAPCSIPAGGGDICTGAADDSYNPVPTLKRLELASVGGTRTFTTVPLAEGINALKLEFGIDNSPNTANGNTNLIGDGAPDLYLPNGSTSTLSIADLTNIVSAKIWMVARSPQSTPNYIDSKTYAMATPTTALNAGTVADSGLTYGPYNDAYKRHLFFTEVRISNLSQRRENP